MHMAESSTNSYDYQQLKFVDTVPDVLLCHYCRVVARDPYKICCGKICCKNCIEANKKLLKRCFQCKKKVTTTPDEKSMPIILLRVYTSCLYCVIISQVTMMLSL